MKAIILAAGRGSRMGLLTNERPKCLLEVGGRSLLDLQITSLRDAGISQIGIVTGFKREALASKGLVEFHNPDWARTNMFASLTCAQAWLHTERCIVSYSDIFYDQEAVRILINCDEQIALTYDSNWLTLWRARFGDPLIDAESFKVGRTGNLLEIGRKPERVEEVQGQYMGLLSFTPKGWKEIAQVTSNLDREQFETLQMTDAIQLAITKGQLKVAALPYAGSWGEVDSPEDLALYNAR